MFEHIGQSMWSFKSLQSWNMLQRKQKFDISRYSLQFWEERCFLNKIVVTVITNYKLRQWRGNGEVYRFGKRWLLLSRCKAYWWCMQGVSGCWIMRRGSMVKPRLSKQDRSQLQPGTCSQGTKKASAELHQQFHIAAHLTQQQSMRNDIERFYQLTKRQCQRVTWPISLLSLTIYLWLMNLLLPCNKCCWWKIRKKLKIICLCCLILNTYMNISYLKSFFNKIELSPCIFLNLCFSFKRGWNITGNTTDTAIRRACKNIFTFTAIINY